MKTVNDFIKEIEGSDALKNELKTIKDKNALADFLKKHDVSATAEEFAQAFKAKKEAEGEIDDDAVAAVAGGVVFRDGDEAQANGIVDWFLGLWS